MKRLLSIFTLPWRILAVLESIDRRMARIEETIDSGAGYGQRPWLRTGHWKDRGDY